MRSTGVVTVARSDFGVYLPILEEIQRTPELELKLFVAAAHLSPTYGHTIDDILARGFTVAERIEMLVDSDSPAGFAMSMGLGTQGFAQAYQRNRPDLLLVLGDRGEMHAAAVAAIPFKIPIAHLHGGEVTEGAIDDVFRHALTKYSHVHFAATETSVARIRQMGEEDWRITRSGAPSIDHLQSVPKLTASEMSERIGLDVTTPTLMVCYHPVTLEYEDTEQQVRNLLAALEQTGLQIALTAPNADTNSNIIRQQFTEFTDRHAHVTFRENLGPEGWPSLMTHSVAMVGNSSSGICEAATFALPVVNIGNRQRGREHGENIVHCGYETNEILTAIERATSAEFRQSISEMTNPYGDGQSAKRIVNRLAEVPLDDKLINKKFILRSSDTISAAKTARKDAGDELV